MARLLGRSTHEQLSLDSEQLSLGSEQLLLLEELPIDLLLPLLLRDLLLIELLFEELEREPPLTCLESLLLDRSLIEDFFFDAFLVAMRTHLRMMGRTDTRTAETFRTKEQPSTG